MLNWERDWFEEALRVSNGFKSSGKRTDWAHKKPFTIFDSKLGCAQKDTYSLEATVVNNSRPDLVELHCRNLM